MLQMTINPPFKDQLFNAFQEWEKQQPKKRSSFSAFARWLSENSLNVKIKQQVFDNWLNGSIPKDINYVVVLAEKLGDWVYESLEVTPPNPYLQKVNRVWEFIPEDIQKKIAEEAATYETQNELSRVSKVSKRRKARKT
jgi:hypothetical protein